ncbi:MAG: hypothetical protein SFV32_04060 [Opitutaceae bacterium]|nr:hypothetical protein [Opitutaceae bacterium]
MNIKELSQKHRYVFFSTVASVLLLGFGVFRHIGLPDLEAERDNLSREAARIHTNVVNASSLAENVQALKELNARAATRVARASDLAGNTQYFYKIEADTGVKEISLTPVSSTAKKQQAQGTYSTVGFNATVEGRFHQVLAFLDLLEGGARYGRINSLSLRQVAKSDTRQEPTVAAVLNVEILALP